MGFIELSEWGKWWWSAPPPSAEWIQNPGLGRLYESCTDVGLKQRERESGVCVDARGVSRASCLFIFKEGVWATPT